MLSPADAAVITNATQAAKAVHRVLFEWRAAAKTRLVFSFFFSPLTHQAVSQQASIFRTRKPPRGRHLLVRGGVRACVCCYFWACDVRATKRWTNVFFFFFLQKFCFLAFLESLSLVLLGLNLWNWDGHHQKVAFTRREMLFIKITYGYVVPFFIFPIYVPKTLSWYHKLFCWYITRFIPFWSILWIKPPFYVSLSLAVNFKF